MDAARSDAGKAIGSATSFGAAGRPSGILPSDFMMTCTASPLAANAGLLGDALRETIGNRTGNPAG